MESRTKVALSILRWSAGLVSSGTARLIDAKENDRVIGNETSRAALKEIVT